MSAPTDIPSPDDITLEAFREQLARYPAKVQALSDAKGRKPGQQTLVELDTFRYETAPRRFAAVPDADGVGGEEMGYEDVKTLVAWKLRHGKFRPSLMRLVESNGPIVVHNVVEAAVRTIYDKNKGVYRTIRCLKNLSGVGPATASLILAVHDPAHIVFFGDEVYAWLCGGGGPPKKYNHREYDDLCAAADALRTRLGNGVQAVDIEKVAFVLLAGDGRLAAQKKEARIAKETARAANAAAVVATRDAKRKRAASPSESGRPLRWVDKVRRLIDDD